MATRIGETPYVPAVNFFCFGLNHRTAPVELLERLSLSAETLTRGLRNALGGGCADCLFEEVVLSTCNRFEIYWAKTATRGCRTISQQVGDLAEEVARLSVAVNTDGHEPTVEPFYLYSDEDVFDHLFRVTCGLDSVVLGEHEIQGQSTAALASAQSAGTAGPFLTELFQSALRAGKRSRAETGIGKSASSIGSVAVQLASEVVENLAGSRVTVVGAGETGELALQALVHRGVRNIAVVNRSEDRAKAISARWGGKAYPLDALTSLLPATDILITAVSAPEPLLESSTVDEAMRGRAGSHPLVIIDIAVPRNVGDEVGGIPNVHLFNLDRIKATHARNQHGRNEQVPHVEKIITEEIGSFRERLGELLMRPVLAGFWKRAESIREEVMDRARKELPELQPHEWDRLDRLARSLVKRLLQTPARRLRDEAGKAVAQRHAETIGYLFDVLPDSGRYTRCRYADDDLSDGDPANREETSGGLRA
ncbi:MAG TPA: glutamyl-tRNA reductase [Spirochaetia bacterium]|nr:glutamyl-tRNA reductase [Spirochaetia bacterium]